MHEKRLRVVFEKLNIQYPTDKSMNLELVGLDSVRLLHLITGLEREFGIDIPLHTLQYENFKTVKDILDILNSLYISNVND